MWQALGLVDAGDAGLFLGHVSPMMSGEAVEAVGKRYLEALKATNELAGFPAGGRPERQILTYGQYVTAVGGIRQLRSAVDNDRYVYDDSPALRRLVDSYSPEKNTADAVGYTHHILDVAPGMWDAVTAGVPAHLPAEDRRRHSYIVAATGSGKSELMKILMAEHARLGHAVLLLDPHSDLAEDLARLPEIAHSGRLVFIRAVEGMSVTINPLEPPRGATVEEKERIAYHLAAVLNSLGGSSATSRMLRFLRSSLRVLLDRPGSTLRDLMALTDPEPPADIIARGRKHYAPSVRSFFTDDIGSRDMEAARNGVRARLGAMLDSSRFQAFTCGKSTLNVEDAIRDGKVMVFDLGSLGNVVGRDVGLLMMAMMTALGERRQVNRARDNERHPVHVFVDECHLVVGEDTADVLDGLRKFGVHLTLAQQRAGQDMTNRVKEAALHTTAVKFVGKSDSADAVLDAIGVERGTLRMLTADFRQPLFQFIVRWGNAKPFIMNVRNDLADLEISDAEWEALLAAQISAHYRPYTLGGDDEPSNDGATTDTTEKPVWELR